MYRPAARLGGTRSFPTLVWSGCDHDSRTGCAPYIRANKRTVSLSADTFTINSSPALIGLSSSLTPSFGAWLSITKLFVSWYPLPFLSVINNRQRYVPTGNHAGARKRTSHTPSVCNNLSRSVSPNGYTAKTELIDSSVFTRSTGSPGWISRGRNSARGAAMKAV